MYELIPVGERSYYINCPAKIGIYKINEHEVCLIDSGNDKETGKKILKILKAENWKLKLIINTHSHADHIGGNNFLQQRTNCPIYTVGADVTMSNAPFLEPSFLFGAYPCKPLRNKFLQAEASHVQELTPEVLPQGLEILRLDGHSFAMIALKTSDDVWFLADCLSSEKILSKYHIPFLYNVEKYIESLQTVRNLKGRFFIPSHADATENIVELIDVNLQKIEEIKSLIKNICVKATSFEDILKTVFDHYQLQLDFNQYVLVGSTLRSFLSFLFDNQEIEILFCENKLLWQTVKTEAL